MSTNGIPEIDKVDFSGLDLDEMVQEKTYDKLHMILDSMFESAAIADSAGVILRASDSFKDFYGLSPAMAIGKTVAYLEQQKFFSPSVIAQVLKHRKIITLTMKTKVKGYVVVTGIPIYDQNGKFDGVVSFLRDANDYVNLKEQYELLENRVNLYSAELEELREKELGSSRIIAKSESFKRCVSLALKVAKVDTNLMITGESGVGKGMIAREVHKKSLQKGGPFIEINCGAIPEMLLESELFGYEKGAFTGAHKNGKVGLIELADKGTLFLDEIMELALSLQVKLLRVLQEKKMTRVGGTKEITVDFRLISATNKDLEECVKAGKFRNDLYYRINVVPIHISPLRERPEDILPIVLNALKRANQKHRMNVRLSSGALKRLLAYEWHGNVREVQNMLERLVVTTGSGLIELETVPLSLSSPSPVPWERGMTLKQALETTEKNIILEAYETYGSSVAVAKVLGVGQTTAARKLRKYLPGYAAS
jgi:PAS domain S-box-containing protein